MTETLEIKQQVKEALYEFFNDDNVILRKMISELMEDIAFGKAIEEGDVGEFVDEKLVLDMLNQGK